MNVFKLNEHEPADVNRDKHGMKQTRMIKTNTNTNTSTEAVTSAKYRRGCPNDEVVEYALNCVSKSCLRLWSPVARTRERNTIFAQRENREVARYAVKVERNSEYSITDYELEARHTIPDHHVVFLISASRIETNVTRVR